LEALLVKQPSRKQPGNKPSKKSSQGLSKFKFEGQGEDEGDPVMSGWVDAV